MNRLPSLFVSHGAPTYALEPGIAGPRLTALGRTLPRPQAVLVVSPHWITAQPKVSASASPQTIHDFRGFSDALYAIEYPASGHPRLAARAVEMLRRAGFDADADEHRGLDHGAWVPLRHLYPGADVPVIQVSMPARLDAHSAYGLGRALAPLADEGVLVVGSGSLTHNLFEFRSGPGRDEPYATEFTRWIREAVVDGDHERLLQALETAPHARRAHPTAEHFLPLLVAAGAAPAALPSTVLEGGIAHGVLSMESYLFGELGGAPENAEADRPYVAARARVADGTRIAVLRIGAERTSVTSGGDLEPDASRTLDIGFAKIAREYFRHAPASAGEIENAIMAIEDALAGAREIGAGRPTLFTGDAAIGELYGRVGAGHNPQATLSREAVERVFDRLASVASGKPAVQEGIPTDGDFAARVLILREFMHHLDFASITVVP